MKEYTLISVVAVVLTVLIARKSASRLFERREFFIFLLIILFFKFLVNGYLTSQLIVIYNPRFFLNVRIGSIPVEDFLFLSGRQGSCTARRCCQLYQQDKNILRAHPCSIPRRSRNE